MAADKNPVRDIYVNVVNDVINGVREAFLDDGMDELVLQELKQLWDSKLLHSKALDRARPPAPEPSQLVSPNRMQQQQQPAALPVTASQRGHPSVPQLNQPGATPLQLARLQSQATASVYGLTPSAQVAANSLPAAFIRHFVNYAPGGQNPGIVLQGMHPSTLTQVSGVPSTDVNRTATNNPVVQLDGLGDSSSEEDDDHEDDDNDDDDDDDDDPNDVDDSKAADEDPLNSEDDVSDADPTEVFDAENVVVCQFEKINRCKNRWKFHLKDGIMNLNGRDYLFQKANGDAEW